jgi:uncharacterized membrane protein YfhO
MEEQSKTIKGALSNLWDAFKQFADNILQENSENAIARWVGTAAEALNGLNWWINGAVTSAGKLAEVGMKIDAIKKQVSASDAHKNGMLGLVDDFFFDKDAKLTELASLQKQQATLFEQLRKDKENEKKLFQADPISVAGEQKRLEKQKADAQDKFWKTYGDNAQKEKIEIDEQTKLLGSLTQAQLAAIHAKNLRQ